MDNASSIKERLNTLRELHENGIYTVLFMSPIFPEITDYKAIIEVSNPFIDQYWFENLNLRGSYKGKILSYIKEKYPELTELYQQIYMKGKKDYWVDLSKDIDVYCTKHKINYINYFYHEELVKAKLAAGKNKN